MTAASLLPWAMAAAAIPHDRDASQDIAYPPPAAHDGRDGGVPAARDLAALQVLPPAAA